MCAVKFSIELYTFQIDDKDLNTNNNSEKSELIFEIDDASVSHPPVYETFLDDSPVRHPIGKVLKTNVNGLISNFFKQFHKHCLDL